MARVQLTRKGRITLPKEVRDELGLKAGTKFECFVDRDGQIVLVPLTVKLEDLIRILPKPERPLTLEEIDEGIQRAAAERATRGL